MQQLKQLSLHVNMFLLFLLNTVQTKFLGTDVMLIWASLNLDMLKKGLKTLFY